MDTSDRAESAAPDFKVVPATYQPRRVHLRGRSDPTHVVYSCKYICWWILGTIFAYEFAPCIFNIATVVRDVDTGSDLYQNWYYRTDVNTTWFPLSQAIVFFCLVVFGWMYIGWVDLYRWNPFLDGKRSYKSFKIMLLLAPIIFLLNGLIVFRQRRDLDGFCDDESKHIMLHASAAPSALDEQNSAALKAVLESDDDTLLFLLTLQRANYMQSLRSAGPVCHEYTDEEIYNWNFKLWFSGFLFIGLQFTHFDVGPMKHFTLAPSEMKKWGPFLWAVFLVIAVFAVALTYDDVKQIIASEVLVRYLLWVALIICFFYFGSKIKGPDYQVHLHHYVIGLIVTSLVSSQSEILTFCHGLFMGMAIEGSCRWGMDPIWKLKPYYSQEEDEAVLDPRKVETHTSTERERWVQIKDHQKTMRRANEKAIAEAVKAQEQVYNPQPVAVPTYLQPALINVPVPTFAHAPSAYNNVAFVSFTQQAPAYLAPQMAQPQMMGIPQVQQPLQVQQPIMYAYHPEPVHQQPITEQVPSERAAKTNLPPELLGLLSPEL